MPLGPQNQGQPTSTILRIIHVRSGALNGHRNGENPAVWNGNLIHALPARTTIAKVEHHAALPFTAVFEFMAQLAARDGMAARALEFTILTAARTGEIIGNTKRSAKTDAASLGRSGSSTSPRHAT